MAPRSLRGRAASLSGVLSDAETPSMSVAARVAATCGEVRDYRVRRAAGVYLHARPASAAAILVPARSLPGSRPPPRTVRLRLRPHGARRECDTRSRFWGTTRMTPRRGLAMSAIRNKARATTRSNTRHPSEAAVAVLAPRPSSTGAATASARDRRVQPS